MRMESRALGHQSDDLTCRHQLGYSCMLGFHTAQQEQNTDSIHHTMALVVPWERSAEFIKQFLEGHIVRSLLLG
jgi:hypothetical protein